MFFMLNIYYENKVYDTYDVISSTERLDTSASEFTEFQGKLLKCTNDGAVYTDLAGNLIWNQTYEIQDIRLAICGNTAAIASYNGRSIYVQNAERKWQFEIWILCVKSWF